MLVSVIIPTFNRAGTIERAVNSVLAQTWKSQEVIVVDDGSTDHTTEVLRKYGDQIKVIRQKNQGPSAARNAGIKAATGEIISFLDSDDEWLPEKTERQLKLLKTTQAKGVKCCVCNARMEFPHRTVTSFGAVGLTPKDSQGLWFNTTQILLYHFVLFNQVVAVRRDALDEAGYFREDLRFLEDYDLALRLSLQPPWAFISEPLVVWHGYEENSLSRDIGKLQACRQAYAIIEALRLSSQFGSKFPRDLVQHHLRRLSRLIHALRLAEDPKPGSRLLGQGLLAFQKGVGALSRRLLVTRRMMTRASVL